MKNLKNWNEPIQGIYKYNIHDNWWYEIHLTYHAEKSDILTATADLYLVGNWVNGRDYGYGYFSRECILKQKTIPECLNMAVKNYENMDFDN